MLPFDIEGFESSLVDLVVVCRRDQGKKQEQGHAQGGPMLYTCTCCFNPRVRPWEEAFQLLSHFAFPDDTPTFTDLTDLRLPGEDPCAVHVRRISHEVLEARGYSWKPKDIPWLLSTAIGEESGLWCYPDGSEITLGRHYFTIPALGEVFSLILDRTRQDLLVTATRYSSIRRRHIPQLEGMQRKYFKLVEVGFQRGLEAVKAALRPHGRVPEGEWLQAFVETYAKLPMPYFVGIADDSWEDTHGLVFPCIPGWGQKMILAFCPSDFEHGKTVVWMVEVDPD